MADLSCSFFLVLNHYCLVFASLSLCMSCTSSLLPPPLPYLLTPPLHSSIFLSLLLFPSIISVDLHLFSLSLHLYFHFSHLRHLPSRPPFPHQFFLSFHSRPHHRRPLLFPPLPPLSSSPTPLINLYPSSPPRE